MRRQVSGHEIDISVVMDSVYAVIREMTRQYPDIGGIGVCWWEGAWIPVGGTSYEENSVLWETYGSGWASSYAGSYDPDDAGRYYGGCACENQALFDFSGHALESLETFRLVRTGNDAPLAVDALDPVTVICDLAGEIRLPETVDAVMNDGSRQSLPVVWETLDEQALREAGPAQYTVYGSADGMQATMTLRMVNYNYLVNGDFESEDNGEWRADNFDGTEQLYIEEKKTDSLDGTRHYHFYSAAASSVGFTIEQDVTDLSQGTYAFNVSIMGGDAGEYEAYAYMKINGETVFRSDLVITSWNSWHDATCETDLQDGDTLTVGVCVVCSGAGAWGKIDGATLTRIR